MSQTKTAYFETNVSYAALKSRAVRAGGITVAGRFINYIAQLGGTVVLARLLSPHDFGLIAMVTSFTGFFMIFKDLGLSEATVQKQSITEPQVNALFWINAAFSIVVTLLIILAAPAISWFYREPRLAGVTILTALSFLTAGFSTQQLALLRRNLEFKKVAIIDVVAISVSTALSIILAYRGFGYWSLALRTIAYGFLTMAGAWLACRWRPGMPRRASGVRSMMHFGANAIGYYFVNYIGCNIDKALIGWKSGAVMLGFYHKAYFLYATPITQITIPLQSVAVAALSKLSGEMESYRRYYLRAINFLAFIGMPLAAFLAISSSDLVNVLLGPQWSETARLFSILGCGLGVQIIGSTIGWLHVSLGRTDRWFRWGVLASCVSTAAIALGLRWGVTGIAVAQTAVSLVLFFPSLLYAGRPASLSFTAIFSSTWREFIASIASAMACRAIGNMLELSLPVLRLSTSIMIYSCLYLLIIILVYRGHAPIRNSMSIMRMMFSKKQGL